MKIERFSRAKKSLCGRILRRILGEECGAVAMEYIVIALLVAAAVVGLVMVFSGNIRNMFSKTNDTLTSTTVEEVKSVGEKYNEEQQLLKGKTLLQLMPAINSAETSPTAVRINNHEKQPSRIKIWFRY